MEGIFAPDEEKKPGIFVFLKLEDHGTLTKEHGARALTHYVFGQNKADCIHSKNSSSTNENQNQNKNHNTHLIRDSSKTITMTKRREDCNRGNKCRCNPGSPNGCKDKDPTYLTLNNNRNPECPIHNFGDFRTDTHIRRGDEFFVPSYISDAIIDTIIGNPYRLVDFKECKIPSQNGGHKKNIKKTHKKSKKDKKVKPSKKIVIVYAKKIGRNSKK
jgi:hypothetical protein